MNSFSRLNPSQRSVVRRCQPLLGTYVEITASGEDERPMQRAIDAAFASIQHVQNRLSVHDPDSELSLLNREAVDRTVTVSAETFEILRHADRLALESGGAFDYTVAPTLARWGMLPANLQRENSGGWRDVLLPHHRQVRFLRPLTLDLGGIAKGFAVDKAVASLQANAVTAGLVNAGGDLRAFGNQSFTIHLRHPSRPHAFAYPIDLRKAALATSSPCFTEKTLHDERVSHLVNPRHGTAITGSLSVTVRARECWVADALTKVVLIAPQRAERLLAKYNAEAFVLTA